MEVDVTNKIVKGKTKLTFLQRADAKITNSLDLGSDKIKLKLNAEKMFIKNVYIYKESNPDAVLEKMKKKLLVICLLIMITSL